MSHLKSKWRSLFQVGHGDDRVTASVEVSLIIIKTTEWLGLSYVELQFGVSF